MVFSYIIWYIVAEKKAGVIVFLWFFTFIDFYFMLKFPRFVPAIIIVIITQILIVGYELQVRTIGLERAEQTGQRYYAYVAHPHHPTTPTNPPAASTSSRPTASPASPAAAPSPSSGPSSPSP